MDNSNFMNPKGYGTLTGKIDWISFLSKMKINKQNFRGNRARNMELVEGFFKSQVQISDIPNYSVLSTATSSFIIVFCGTIYINFHS